MIRWKEIQSNIENQIDLLRKNQEDNDIGRIISQLVESTKLFLNGSIDNNNVKECINRLHNLINAYSSGDIILLADVLEYEILDMVIWIESYCE